MIAVLRSKDVRRIARKDDNWCLKAPGYPDASYLRFLFRACAISR